MCEETGYSVHGELMQYFGMVIGLYECLCLKNVFTQCQLNIPCLREPGYNQRQWCLIGLKSCLNILATGVQYNVASQHGEGRVTQCVKKQTAPSPAPCLQSRAELGLF